VWGSGCMFRLDGGCGFDSDGTLDLLSIWMQNRKKLPLFWNLVKTEIGLGVTITRVG
jgi:hypothetical protein